MTAWNTSSIPQFHSGVSDWDNHTTYLFRWGSLVSISYPLPGLIILALILTLVIVVPAIANLLVGLALFKYRPLRTISNYLIGNLALSDFLLATTVLPLSVCNECLGHWVFGRTICNAWLICDALYCTASLWNICVIAFDRFTATFYPIWYREKRSAKQAATYVLLVWAISATICLPPALGWIDLAQNYQYDEQLGVYKCHLISTLSYVLFSAFGSFYVPFFITFLLYGLILAAIRKRTRKIHKGAPHYNGLPDKIRCSLVVPCHTPTNLVMDVVQGKGPHDTNSVISAGAQTLNETNGIHDRRSSYSRSRRYKRSVIADDDFTNTEETTITESTFVTSESIQSHMDSDYYDTVRNGAKEMSCSNNANLCFAADGVVHPVNIASTPEVPETTGKCKELSTAKQGVTIKKVNPYKKMVVSRSSGQNRRQELLETRATIRMAIIISFFCGMWIGFSTVYVIHACCKDCRIPASLDAFFFWLGYANSSINPVLYAVFNEEFRKAFQKILGCDHRRLR